MTGAVTSWPRRFARWIGDDTRGVGEMRTGSSLLLAVALTIAAFPPYAWWPCAFGMLAPLVFCLEGRGPRAVFGLTYVYYATMGIAITRWLVHAMAFEYRVATPSAWFITLLLVGSFSLIPAAAVAGFAGLRPRVRTAAAPLAFAAVWILAEWLRAEVGRLPWLLSAHALAPFPPAIQLAAVGGSHAVGFVLVCINAGLGMALARRDLRPLAVPAALGLAALAYAAVSLRADVAGGSPLRVGVVQAAIPQAYRFQPGSAERNTARHLTLTRSLLAREVLDLVVWSETALDGDIDEKVALREDLERLVAESGVPLVTGARRSAEGRRTNAAVLITPEHGVAESYAKQWLVPFAEYHPSIERLLGPLLGPVTESEPYVPGAEAHVFSEGPVAFASPICFEITYPSLVRRFRNERPLVLLNLSNDAWFGTSGYARMHLDHAIFRAVELRSWVVRAANTGISAVIDPRGRIVSSVGLFEMGDVTAVVRPTSWGTPYARLGDAPVLALLVLVLAAACRRRRAEPDST